MRSLLITVAISTLVLVGCGSGTQTSTSGNGAVETSGTKNGAVAGELDVESGATSITVRAAVLGPDFYRVETPAGAGVAPSVVRHGSRVQVFLAAHGSGPSSVTILLSDSVRWRVRFNGGASDLVVDLHRTRVSAVDFAAGDTHIGLDLSTPRGSVPIRMSGGASELALHVARGTPVRIAVDGGAASVNLDGTAHTGVAGGTVFTPAGWTAATNRYDVDAHAGVSTLTLDRR